MEKIAVGSGCKVNSVLFVSIAPRGMVKRNEKQIFISHSGQDKQIVDFFVSHFDDTNVKPILMEYEKWSRNGEPNWLWIRREIEKSEALFVILTSGIISKKHTQNWVAFEIGIAASCHPPKPVYVFREEEIDFPVPYLNHYFPYSLSSANADVDFSTNPFLGLGLFFVNIAVSTGLVELIKKPRTKVKEDNIECLNCRTKFVYWGDDDEFPCPCCSERISKNLIKT